MTEKITPKKFAIIVDELVRTKRLTHMEAIIYYCEQNLIEPDTITKWIDRSLKEKHFLHRKETAHSSKR